MKTVSLVWLGLCLATSGFSATDSKVEKLVQLNFEMDKSHHSLVNNFSEARDYLTVVREEVRFPSGRQHDRLDQALDLLEEIMNSDEFRRKVTTYIQPDGTANYQKNYLWNETDKTLSRHEVYNIIMEGWEASRPDTAGEMNLNIKKYHSWWSRVIGWTSPSSSKWINVNWRFYKRYQVHEMVGNIVHEWVHLLGFLHGNQKLHQEVPYVVGAIAGQIAKNRLDKK
ncbi:MAG: hypothetical protein CME62_04070 [Halobacteriovoraceae bacterium]|nr:hypothetical protein [Halobacteriovoraceae bacterium]|tara:strand:- start:3676 stop:4353 length:678 start_codon:yes stop_codon:yes gene_type:complete